MLALLFLLVRPQGLFGEKIIERFEGRRALPRSRTVQDLLRRPTRRSFRSRRTAGSSSASLAFAFLAVPLFADQYLYTEVLIPVLILSHRSNRAQHPHRLLRAVLARHRRLHGGGGLCGLQPRAARARDNDRSGVPLRRPDGDLVGILFGLPSLRIKGFYLAVATLAAQFFLEWAFARMKWLTNYAPSGSVAVGQ